MTEQRYREVLVRIRQLAEAWKNCDCAGACHACLDRICIIEELAAEALGDEWRVKL